MIRCSRLSGFCGRRRRPGRLTGAVAALPIVTAAVAHEAEVVEAGAVAVGAAVAREAVGDGTRKEGMEVGTTLGGIIMATAEKG